MTKAQTNARAAQHGVDALFVNRHSPRAFTDAVLSEAELLTMLEAARWAPSASNHQPTRFAYALRGTPEFQAMADGLMAFNAIWAPKAAALVVIASKETAIGKEGEAPNRWHGFDAGAAWVSLALQAEMMGWHAHAMGGYEHDAIAAATGVQPGYEIHAVIAIGQKGDAGSLPEARRPGEVPNDRRPLAEIAAQGRFPG